MRSGDWPIGRESHSASGSTRTQLRRSASAVLSELVIEAAQQDARDRVLEELAAGEEIPEREARTLISPMSSVLGRRTAAA